MDQLKTALCAFSLCLLVGCGARSGDGESGGGDGPVLAGDCSIGEQNRWVDAQMRDFYLFYDQVPTLDLDTFSDPAELVRQLRVNPPDRFSNMQNAETQGAFFSQGKSFGYGFSTAVDEDDLFRFTNISGGSPMEAAGIKRGEIFDAIDGEPFAPMTNERFRELIGTPPNSKSPTFTIIDQDGAARDVVVTSGEYDFRAVQGVYTQEIDGVVYGYLPFLSFTNTAEDELEAAFETFNTRGVTELILDLRYNGGGRTFIAHGLASLIAGPGVFGEVVEELRFNDKYTSQNEIRRFPTVGNALSLSRVAVLTTNSTASSSEIVINSLKPYIDVSVIGDTTSGKPFQTIGRDNCGQRLNAVEIISTNSAGGDVTGGITPDCVVEDDFTADYGSADEALLNAGINWLRNGVCVSGGSPLADANFPTEPSAGQTLRAPELSGSLDDDANNTSGKSDSGMLGSAYAIADTVR